MKKLLLFIGFLLVTTIGYSQGADFCIVHSATSGNISGNATIIDHPALNNNPSAKLFVTHSLNGDGTTTYNDKTTGVYYSVAQGNKWLVYNEDSSNMLESSSYNVYVSGTQAGIVETVSPGGTWWFIIDDPLLNDKPNIHPVITHVYGNYLDHNYGLYYSATNKWGILCEDGVTEIPAGHTFNVLAEPSDVGYNTDTSYMHDATSATQIYNNGTLLDHPLLNNNPDATFVITHKYNVGDLADQTFGTFYDSSENKWIIYSENPPYTFSGEDFHVVISLPSPVNDLCANATPLTVGVDFDDEDIVSTLLASDGSFYGNVWFSVTVPAAGSLTIETDYNSGSPMHDTWMAAWSGSCGSLTFITSDDNGGNGNFSKMVLSGQTPGATIYIGVEEDMDSPDPTGTFKISAYDISLGIADEIIDGFSMYPNPVEDMLNIKATNTIESICIYNMLGQEVINTSQTQIDMSALTTGSYIVKVQTGDQIGSYNLIKQ